MSIESTSTETQTTRTVLPGQPLNGCRLVMALPVYGSGSSFPRGHYVVVDRGDDAPPDRYVAAWVTTLDSPTWSLGDYCTSLNRAIESAFERWGGKVQGLIAE